MTGTLNRVTDRLPAETVERIRVLLHMHGPDADTTWGQTLTSTQIANNRAELAYLLRQARLPWAHIAREAGYINESSARTAANRYAARIGQPHNYVRNRTERRATGQRATRVRARSVGVEIEFVDGGQRTATKSAVARAVADEIYPGRNPCPVYGIHIAPYHGNRCTGCQRTMNYRYWKVEADASVDNRTMLGGEVVSPVLRGEPGLDEMRRVMKVIRSVGGAVDARCGLHVHVGAENMTNEQRARVIETLHKHHGVLNRLVAPSRLNNVYCRQPSENEIRTWADNMRRTGLYGYGDKYRSINVAKFPVIGTIEIRLHQGTLNGRKATAWVNFLVGIFDGATRDADEGFAPGLALLGSLAEAGLMPQTDAGYLMARAETLARARA